MNFSKHIQNTSKVCNVHHTPIFLVMGRESCRNCADEYLSSTKAKAQGEIDAVVRTNHFNGAKLPERYTSSGFANYVVSNSGQLNAKEHCIQYAKNAVKGCKNNLVMVGSTGTGKTHLACATARNLLNKGLFTRYITSADLITNIKATWSQDNDNEESAIYRFSEYDLLIIDEYGLHDRNETLLALVHKVLYARYDIKKPTMLISNLTIEALKDDLGDRIWSRFQHDGLTTIECNWVDARTGGAA